MTIAEERARIISPIVPESVMHNARVISQLRSLTASLFGIAAGILGLESTEGFLFYLFGCVFVSELVISLRAEGHPERYFGTGINTRAKEGKGEGRFSGGLGIYGMDVVGGLSSYVLTWTLFYGLVRS